MPTAVDTSQLTDSIHALKEAAELAIRNESLEDFEEVERQISVLEAYVRELQQAMWVNEVKTAARRLERDEPLNEADREVVRTFLVSDAEHYLAQENNYGEWIAELRRLLDEMARRANTLDRHTVGELRGVVKDAVRLAPDIRNYLDEQRRVERFNEALGHLDKSSRELLVRLLREQLRSATR
ncbi:MAG: hypothetical protein HY763_10955 [Planctomycetes bacterium]|nr:hypothetical protein [Planctomycetota bacterium]